MAKDGSKLRGLMALCAVLIFLFFETTAASAMGARPPQEMTYSYSIKEDISFVEVVNYNVGNVGVDLRLPGFKCPSFKLCWSWTADALRDWFVELDADVILLQETMGAGQVFGEDWGGPLISDELYDGECQGHICVAWRRDAGSRSPDEKCRSYRGPYGKLLSCAVEFYGQRLQLVSVYYPAVNIVFADVEQRRQERSVMADILFEGAQDIVDPQAPLVVGGDFNSANFTYKDSLPYPKNFYTLFGRHVVDHGLSGEDGGPLRAPAHNFFGVYEGNKPISLSTHYAFGYNSKFDQVYANFGFPLSLAGSGVCPEHACLEGRGGLLPLREIRPGQDGTDHEGIFARVGWKTHRINPKMLRVFTKL